MARYKLRIFRIIRLNVILAIAAMVSQPAFAYGVVRICVASDFDWTNRKYLDLPPRTIFEFAGKLCGDLYQPTELRAGDPQLKCYNAKEGRYDREYQGGYLITTESAILTSAAPCTTAHARMYVVMPDSPRYARSDEHEAWLGWRVLGFSIWHDDFGTPEGQPNDLGPVFDRFQIRAQIVSDLADPLIVTPSESVHLQDQIDTWNKRANAR